jgi:5-methyltetrahydrofolate--homocysteine methyltransferase
VIIVGERINSTREKIREAIKARDASFILRETTGQLKSGADYIDVNCAVTGGDELRDIEWAINVIQKDLPDAGICIDSPNHLAIEQALAAYKGKGRLLINSITLGDSRISKILPLAIKYNTGLIALTMSEAGMPDTAEARRDIAWKIFEMVKRAGFDTKKLFFDPLIRPISTEPEQAREVLRSIPLIRELGASTICGLSNISFGLPNRHLINAVFLSMAYQMGLDAAILDPLDRSAMSALKTAKAVLGEDEYCAGYLQAYRAGFLVK